MRFKLVQILTSKLSRQVEFYQQLLGLTVLEHSDKAVSFQVGSSRLEFIQDSSHNAFYHFAFNVPSHQFAHAKKWLSGRVALLQDASGNDEFHSQNWNADNIYFYDAAGNVVEFIARHSLISSAYEGFSAASLECISELGIVTDNVAQTVKHIQALTGASLYHATMDEAFVPLGDETALFIVVKQGRIWFPETKAALISAFKIQLDGSKRGMLELDHHSIGLPKG